MKHMKWYLGGGRVLGVVGSVDVADGLKNAGKMRSAASPVP
jgi:hypothetical protein